MKARFLAIALFSLPVLALADGSLKSQIPAMNKPIVDAMMKLDIDAFNKAVKGGVTPDFKYYDDGSSAMNYKTMTMMMKQGFGMYAKMIAVGTQPISVVEKGNKGLVVQKHSMAGMTKPGADKKSHKIVFIGTSTETYKKVHGKWMMASMSMKTDLMTMDGKPMPMGGAPRK